MSKEYMIMLKDIYGSLIKTDWDTLENIERKYSFMSLKEARKYGIVDYWIVQKPPQETLNERD